MLEVALLLEDVELGFSRAVSIGNQADLGATELVAALGEHDGTRVIGLYCEDFLDGRAFVEAARTAGKPVVLLTAGRTEAGSRAARSHTGALTSGREAVEAACRAAGIHLVDTPRGLVDVAQALLAPHRPRGGRVAVVGDGGGYGAIASDLLGGRGIELPALSERTQAALRDWLPANASTANPVDLAGAGEQDVFSFAHTTRALLGDDGVDAVLFTAYFGGYSTLADELGEPELAAAELLGRAMAESGKPLVVHTMHWNTPPSRALRAAGVPVYRAIESAVDAIAALVADGAPDPLPLPSLPAPAAPLTDSGYAAARAALAEAGIPFGPARTVRSRDEALAAAAELGYPVVLKALGLLHKSDAGGIALGLRDEQALAAAFDDLPPGSLRSRSRVEAAEDVAAGFELLVGARRDPRFGPLVVVAAGGIQAELARDVAVALAPVDVAAAETLVRSLGSAPLLLGRPRPPAARRRGRRTGRRRAVELRRRAPRDRGGRGQPVARDGSRAPSASTPAWCSHEAGRDRRRRRLRRCHRGTRDRAQRGRSRPPARGARPARRAHVERRLGRDPDRVRRRVGALAPGAHLVGDHPGRPGGRAEPRRRPRALVGGRRAARGHRRRARRDRRAGLEPICRRASTRRCRIRTIRCSRSMSSPASTG